MRRIAPALLLLAALGGCDLARLDAEFTNEGCRKAMYDDPAVKGAVYSASTVYGSVGGQELVLNAKRAAYDKCMRGEGIAPPGAVERVKKGWL